VAESWDCGTDVASAVQAEQGFPEVDCYDGGELAIGYAERSVRSAEQNPFALGENALLPAEDFDTRESTRNVREALAIGGLDNKPVGVAINRLDAGVPTLLERHLLAPASETDDFADLNLIAMSVTPLRSRKIASHKNSLVDALRSDMATRSQGLADRGVELPAFDVGGADDQHPLSGFVRDGILRSDRAVARADIRYLADAMVPVEQRERIGDLARRGKPTASRSCGSRWRRMVSSSATDIPACCI
jgi:hypothetical protein